MSNTKHSAFEQYREEVAALNKAVTDAIAARRARFDELMPLVAEHPIGAELVDMRTGAPVGAIQSYYRYWRDRDEGVRDTSIAVEYRFTNGGNTSSMMSSVGTVDEWLALCVMNAEAMKARATRFDTEAT